MWKSMLIVSGPCKVQILPTHWGQSFARLIDVRDGDVSSRFLFTSWKLFYRMHKQTSFGSNLFMTQLIMHGAVILSKIIKPPVAEIFTWPSVWMFCFPFVHLSLRIKELTARFRDSSVVYMVCSHFKSFQWIHLTHCSYYVIHMFTLHIEVVQIEFLFFCYVPSEL